MEKLKTLTLAADGAVDQVEKGRFRIPVGKMLRGIRLRIVIPIQNSTGGNYTSTAAQRIAWLNKLQITLKYGANGTRVPFAQVGGGLIREVSRFAISEEVDRFSDSTVGLATQIANTVTSNLRCQLYIPTGRLFLDAGRQNVFGMGWSQTRTIELLVKRLPDSGFAASTATNGTITCDVIPDYVSSTYNRWTYIPEATQLTVPDYERVLDDMFPLFVAEQTNVHSASTVTALTTKIGEEFLLNNIDPQDWLDVYNDAFPYSGFQNITDTDTLLYAIRPDQNAEDYPVGRLYINQPQRQMNPMKLLVYGVPLVGAAEIKRDMQYLSDNVEMAALRAVSYEDVAHTGLPERLRPFLPFCLFKKTDAEFETHPGWVSTPGGQSVELFLPNSVVEKAQRMMAHHAGHGEHSAAANVAAAVSRAVPGAAESTYTGTTGGMVHALVTSALGKPQLNHGGPQKPPQPASTGGGAFPGRA